MYLLKIMVILHFPIKISNYEKMKCYVIFNFKLMINISSLRYYVSLFENPFLNIFLFMACFSNIEKYSSKLIVFQKFQRILIQLQMFSCMISGIELSQSLKYRYLFRNYIMIFIFKSASNLYFCRIYQVKELYCFQQ